MRTLVNVLLKLAVCIAALFLAEQIFPDKVYSEGIAALLTTGAVLWLVNICIRPIVKFFSLPITIVTLGLFSLVINALMVKLAAWVVPGMTIEGFWVCVVISLLVSVMNVLFVKKKGSRDDDD